ncbi:hypothetical protein P7D22_15050 [Lichenihabitans sp. Uapishka_5]|uniref:hypothetical protein n=1 Tax=Lichenihabitans sp. Uapishka_5 TaxID=3037302 RepID=UPI0029E7D73B|nr:hypothetical protein [Lichenihabitans sp. Uapishka_5]MDX7952485.1 hypothetical protein [Lichenihabitans sp. Uapishka_5]
MMVKVKVGGASCREEAGVAQVSGWRRRSGLAVLAVAMMICAPVTQGFAADDGGIGAFFRQQFGIGGNDAAPAPEPAYEAPQDRPVIVRRRHARPAQVAVAKIAVGPVAPVSIFDDRTLKRGDAVMTKTGLRVFVGGHGAPYTDADFAALDEAPGLSKQTEKALLLIDRAPRG